MKGWGNKDAFFRRMTQTQNESIDFMIWIKEEKSWKLTSVKQPPSLMMMMSAAPTICARWICISIYKIVTHCFEWQTTVSHFKFIWIHIYFQSLHTKKSELSHKFIDRIRNESKDWIVVRLVWLGIYMMRLFKSMMYDGSRWLASLVCFS